jgi:ABC-2 type transport system permease protein
VSLFKAESRRLGKRRFIRYSFLAALLTLLVVSASVFFSSQKIGPEQHAAARVAAQAAYQDAVTEAARMEAECTSGRLPAPGGTTCDTMWNPSPEDYRAEDYLATTFDFRAAFGDMITAFAALLALAAFIGAASFVGAEWVSGGMMNLLLWRPRRLQVLGTKLAALLAGVGGLTVVAAAAWTGLFLLIATLRGTTAGMTAGAWQSVGLTWLRALALILVAATVGYALAALGRHTAISLGVAVGFVIVTQFALIAVLSSMNVRFIERYAAPTYLDAWMNKTSTLEDYSSCTGGFVECKPAQLVVDWPIAGVVFISVMIILMGAAMWSMRSRDVT